MLVRALHDEVCRGRVLARDLGADAGVARLERAIGQSRPVAPDRRRRSARRAADPPCSRSCPPIPRPGRSALVRRGRASRARPGRPARAPGRRGARTARASPACSSCPWRRARAARARRGSLRCAARGSAPAVLRCSPPARQGSVRRPRRATRCRPVRTTHFASGLFNASIAPARSASRQEGEHQGVAVDDPRGGRVQRRHAVQLRFHRASSSRAQTHDIGDAVGVRSPSDALQLLQLRGVGGDDELAAAPVRHPALGAVGVQALADPPRRHAP